MDAEHEGPWRVMEWRGTRPESYQAYCPGLHDPGARQGYYLMCPGRKDEPLSLQDAVAMLATDFREDRYLDFQPWRGPDADPDLCYHVQIRDGQGLVLRRSRRIRGVWTPESQLWWPNYVGSAAREVEA